MNRENAKRILQRVMDLQEGKIPFKEDETFESFFPEIAKLKPIGVNGPIEARVGTYTLAKKFRVSHKKLLAYIRQKHGLGKTLDNLVNEVRSERIEVTKEILNRMATLSFLRKEEPFVAKVWHEKGSELFGAMVNGAGFWELEFLREKDETLFAKYVSIFSDLDSAKDFFDMKFFTKTVKERIVDAEDDEGLQERVEEQVRMIMKVWKNYAPKGPFWDKKKGWFCGVLSYIDEPFFGKLDIETRKRIAKAALKNLVASAMADEGK